VVTTSFWVSLVNNKLTSCWHKLGCFFVQGMCKRCTNGQFEGLDNIWLLKSRVDLKDASVIQICSTAIPQWEKKSILEFSALVLAN